MCSSGHVATLVTANGGSRAPTAARGAKRAGMRPEAEALSRSIAMRDLKKFFRANPQVLVLLVICVVLGLGTFLAVVFGLVSAGSTQVSGEPSGMIQALGLLG
jgi:hypothetical protein